MLTCPVVPRSAMRLHQDEDGFVVYTVVVLAKFYSQFKVRRFAPYWWSTRTLDTYLYYTSRC